jgi:hypothetical protein
LVKKHFKDSQETRVKYFDTLPGKGKVVLEFLRIDWISTGFPVWKQVSESISAPCQKEKGHNAARTGEAIVIFPTSRKYPSLSGHINNDKLKIMIYNEFYTNHLNAVQDTTQPPPSGASCNRTEPPNPV